MIYRGSNVIKKIALQEGASIKQAMQVINSGELGICFVLRNRCLTGVITDGDLRRALLNGSVLEDAVETVMRKDFCSLSINTSLTVIQDKLRFYKFIPIINSQGELVDLASSKKYHHIPLVQPQLNGNELEYVTECIQSSWISSQGKYVRLFEESFGEYVGTSNVLAVSNGTVALHLALVSLGVGKGDEVIVPDLTFAATINAVLYTGATPIIVDVNPKTMVIDLEQVKRAITEKTKAVIPVHLYGYPVDLAKLIGIAKERNIMVIEDCAEALGTIYRGKHVGTTGDASMFSFFGNKTVTTGEGGMVLFRCPDVLDRARILRDHGMSPNKRYWHNEIGFNYRLTNVQAAIGVAQLENINYIVTKKRWIALIYSKYLADMPFLLLPEDPSDYAETFNSYWLYTVVLQPQKSHKRDEIIKRLLSNGIEARPVFFPLHRMPPYKKYSLPTNTYKSANLLADGGISLPSSVSITEEEIKYVCDSLQEALEGE